jgi:hypothetical protein
VTLFDADHVGRFNPNFDTSGVAVHNATDSTVGLSSDDGAVTISQSRYIFPYQPGKSLLIMLTFAMSDSVTSTERVGYFCATHGIFFEKAAGVYNFVIRSNTVDEERVIQSSWSDRQLMKGSAILDASKAQIFWCDMSWLGVGSVRCGFVIEGQHVICHKYDHSNSAPSTYMRSAKLPVRYEITEPTMTTSTLTQICTTVIAEGGHNLRSIPKSIGKYDGLTSISSPTSILSIKLGDALINDIIVVLSAIDILAQGTATRAVYYTVLHNPGEPEIPIWTPIVDSAVEYSESPDFSGGTIIHSGYVTSRSVLNLNPTGLLNIQLGRSIGLISDIITLRVGNVTGAPTVASSMSWYEI